MRMNSLKNLSLAFLASGSLISSAGEQVELFNSKDLTGWTSDGYEVKNGTIICALKGQNLITEKEYSNYVFSFEFKLPPSGNNGIAIHYPGTGDPAYTGMEIQVLELDSGIYFRGEKNAQVNLWN